MPIDMKASLLFHFSFVVEEISFTVLLTNPYIVINARNVYPLWWNICKDPLMWRTIHMTCRFNFSRSRMEKICRCAIGLSCGHLEEIAVRGFGTDERLKYMAHR